MKNADFDVRALITEVVKASNASACASIQELPEGEYYIDEGLGPPSKLILGTSNRIF